jgi:adenosylcobinamide-phosphate guanylyltransferase
MKAIIMAGGRGKRLNLDIEKPLVKINGRTILERIVKILRDTGIDEIFVAVTNATPKTKTKAKELKVRMVQTPGSGYVKDIQYLMKKFKEFLVVSADLPFLNSKLIRDVLNKYEEIQQSVSVVVPKKDYEKMGFTPTVVINNLVPIGVNIVAKGEDYLYITKGKETININKKEELEMIIK